MNSKVTQVIYFAVQNLYIVVVPHHKSRAIGIYSDKFELKTFSQEPDVNQLIKHLQQNYPGALII
ncbi:hypothetical protein A3860_37960 [Niastella vici]|uniref:Uncharacterized protein n=1 Tax=Niastella vici TaxID=1703345 RepID=A0A1V9FLL4_9BACT|nr:hypothetical protein [Niastella vici]OQP59242.1 hypothetical protein A3860_37960 [Niastella vici]